MRLFKSFLLATLFLVFLAPSIVRADATSYDTDGDGTNDFTLRTEDTDGDGSPNKIHFDTDNDGVEDEGELVINCRSASIIVGNHKPGGLVIKIKCDTGTETTTSTYHVRDNNKDGDTSDKGEVAPPKSP